MDEVEFWRIVDAARIAAGGDEEARIETLRQGLAALPPAALQAFQQVYDRMLQRAYRWDLWGAAYLMNGGCSDDGFRYFRDWLISEGRDVFERALQDPDSLADAAELEYFELESFGWVASEVFAAKGGGEIAFDPASESGQPAGKQWEEEDLATMFPRLAARFDAQ